jgi:hypothetical protein
MGEPGAHRDRLYCTGQGYSHFPRPRDDIIGRRTTVREDLVSEWQRRPVPMEESAYNSRIAPLRSAHWDDVVDQKCEAHPQVIPHPSDGLDIVATLPGRAEYDQDVTRHSQLPQGSAIRLCCRPWGDQMLHDSHCFRPDSAGHASQRTQHLRLGRQDCRKDL